jgi:hypothetical protein
MKRATEICKYMPVEFKLIKRLLCSFGTLFVDMDPELLQPVIYSIASSRFIELRGTRTSRKLSANELNGLYVFAGNQSSRDSLLDLLYTAYLKAKYQGRRSAFYSSFKTYVDYMIQPDNFQKLNIKLQQVSAGDSASDLDILRNHSFSKLRVYISLH